MIEHFERVQRLFHEAQDLAPEDRDGFLARACGDDSQLRDEVSDLLRASAEADGFLARPTVASGSPVEDGLHDSGLPEEQTQVGPYRLLEKIGRGGFGVVYLAEQEEPVRRRVALKVIKLGMDTEEVIARFAAERQALALMDHPSIAKVFDAGATSSGRPFFVMELVDGIPITEHVSKHDLSLRDLLELFIRVCRAIQHAHQKGVIHRDIKPSNVLVTDCDGLATPKVIDFGIAKATDVRLSNVTMLTKDSQFLGTPAYMSPEQAGALDELVDTRSDIYSLGVLLYELLTGTTPLPSSRLRRASVDEIQRLISSQSLPTPSTRIRALGTGRVPDDTGSRDVGSRSPSRALRRSVRGDLDWIVMKALEKDPVRRYETTSAFAADLERYLANEPVEARPPSRAYRVGKFVRRHRLVVAASGAVLAALVVGLVLAAYGLVQARRSAELAEGSATEAGRSAREAREAAAGFQAEATRANAIVSLFENIFHSANPYAKKGADYTVRALLDDFARDFEKGLPEDRSVEQRLRLTMARAYIGLDAIDQAELHVQRAFELRDSDGEPGPHDAEVLRHLGWVLQRRGATAEAEKYLLQALDLHRKQLGEDDPETLKTLVFLADLKLSSGQRREGEALAGRVLASRRVRLGDAHPLTRLIHSMLALSCLASGRLGEAEEHFEDVIRDAPPDPEDRSGSLAGHVNLAGIHFQQGHNDVAEGLYALATPAVCAAFGSEQQLAQMALTRLEILYTLGRRFDEADLLIDCRKFGSRGVRDDDSVTTLVRRGSDWKFLDDGSDQGTDWRRLEFDDGSWPSGASPLGFGEPLLGTVIQRGSEAGQRITTYFRRVFVVDDARSFTFLKFRIRRDDGVAVFLNGAEVLRDNVPGAASAQDPAEYAESGLGEWPYRAFVVPSTLRAGENVLAVELHQSSPSSSDAVFDLQLEGLRRTSQNLGGPDAEIPERLRLARLLSERLARPPATPDIDGPSFAASANESGADASALELVTSEFRHERSDATHVRTHWQIRREGGSYRHGAVLDIVSEEHLTRLDATDLLFEPGVTYYFRAAHTSSPGGRSFFGPEREFRSPAGPARFEVLPIDLSGLFNVDVVADPGDEDNDGFDPDASLLIVSGPAPDDVPGGAYHGLPPDRRVGVHLLGSYERPNGLQLSVASRDAVQIPVPSRPCAWLRVLVSGSNGRSSLPVRLRYADGTESLDVLPCDDWFRDPGEGLELGLSPIWNGMDRWSGGGVERRQDPALFEARLRADPTRALVALQLEPGNGSFDGDRTRCNILAITLLVMPGQTGR